MGRPWDYPRWRRVLMQAVMWLILGGALGLAQLVTYHRNHTPVALGPPVRLGEVMVRLPEGWLIGRLGLTLEAQNPEDGRIVKIGIEPAPSQSSDQSQGPPGPAVNAKSIEFAGLHEQGWMALIPRVQTTSQGLARADVLSAVSALPSGRLIVIDMPIAPRVGPADRLLLQNIANGITPVRNKGRAALPRPR